MGNLGVIGGGTFVAKFDANGNFGIGTTTPHSRFEVWGPDTASTTAFLVANNASTTVFSVYDTGNAILAGNLTQNSDQRLKTNIQSLDASSSLAAIDALNPVTFNWIDPSQGSTPQLGFIAQQVQSIFPNLVSTTSPTALTPDGTLSLNSIDLISPIVSAVQALSTEITSMESTVAGFAQPITSAIGNFGRVNTNELCVGSICVTAAQFQAMVAAANQSRETPSSSTNTNTASTTPDTPPVIAINGDNPAIIQVGATYTDLGATITGPQADLNPGLKTFLNGALVSNIVIDTSSVATDTIDYAGRIRKDFRRPEPAPSSCKRRQSPHKRKPQRHRALPLCNSRLSEERAAFLLQLGKVYAVRIIRCEHKDDSEQQGGHNCSSPAVPKRYEISDKCRDERES